MKSNIPEEMILMENAITYAYSLIKSGEVEKAVKVLEKEVQKINYSYL